MSLLDASAGPILKDFPEDVPAPADLTGWACPINLAKAQEEFEDDAGLAISLIREISFLMPWYDMAVHKRGRTTVGVSGINIQKGAEFLVAFLYDQNTPSPRDDLSLGDALKLVSEDVKAFFLEAVTAQPGAASSSQLADWFWRETEAGKLLLDLKAACLKSSDPSIKLLGTLLIVPRSQEHRNSS